MNDGVALLLDRMKTNPEEFTEGKWNALIQSHKMFLNKEDCEALDAGINALMQQQFTEKVMEELVDPKKSIDLSPWVATESAMPSIKSVPFNLVEHIEAHEKFLGQTPIAGVTQTL
jgi:hypothetical protein